VQRERRLDLAATLALCAAKAIVSAVVLRLGFSHVSDDDFARVVIAQSFARAPKLDPSGTSWLPFPFWLQGGVMMLFGRTLAVARATAFVLGVASMLPPFFMARAAGLARTAATLGALLGGLTAWNAWLGVATVPEALAASLAASGAIALAAERGLLPGAACLLIASLSRYEAWPVCAVFSIAAAVRWRRTRARDAAIAAGLALVGPLAWMAWNASTHGDALHFFARVSRFHEAHAGAAGFGERLWLYPAGLVRGAPEIAIAGVVAAFAMRSGDLRARWKIPGLCAIATLAFLIVGNLRGGAPTHHAERALLPIWWIVALAGAEACARIARPRYARTLFAVAWLSVPLALWRPFPGTSESERRDAQIARGLELRAEHPARVHVWPCAYEHFALLAAYGEPENATIEPPSASAVCPRIEVTPR
jgi:hypothetical protein